MGCLAWSKPLKKNWLMKKKPRLGANRAALERMYRIHQLLQNEEYPNSINLAVEFEVVKRTIKRDIEFMRDRLNLPLAFDTKRKGYYYTRSVHRFPELPMSEADIFALFVASKAIEQYQGTPFRDILDRAFRRLTGRLDEHVKFTLRGPEQTISFRPFGPGEADLRAFETLAKGVRERRVVTFLYRNHGALGMQRRRVHPYHIAHVDGRWYLFGFDLNRSAERTFDLSRLTRPRLLATRFEVPTKFDLNEHLGRSFGVFRGKDEDDYEVVVDFDAWAADEIRGRHWHSSQEITDLPKGALRLRLRLNNIEEVEKWVAGFGIHATVVRPEVLRERLARIGCYFQERYGSAAAPLA
jgi:predicted DNA-binding transcriptional regulator YafY